MDILAQIIRGLLGMATVLGIAYALSANRNKVNWRLVAGGLVLQVVIALLLLKDVPGVAEVFDFFAAGFVTQLGFAADGAKFVFGAFGDPAAVGEAFGANRAFVFAFHALPSIIFVSALSSLLYYFGILQFIVKGIAWVMSRAMRLSGAESLAAAANVFIGQTEAPLLVKPYIPTMTRSELMALMVGGMETIAGSVFAIYIGFLGGGDPEETQLFAKVLLQSWTTRTCTWRLTARTSSSSSTTPVRGASPRSTRCVTPSSSTSRRRTRALSVSIPTPRWTTSSAVRRSPTPAG